MKDRIKVGISACFFHADPKRPIFTGKTLQYLEQSIAHWIMSHGALVLMLPTLGFDAEVSRRRVSVRNYVQALDGLVLQGGADVSPSSYGQQPLRPEWSGDLVRDRYEIELLEGFLAQGKPILGICRGEQLINVYFGGTLLQGLAGLYIEDPEIRTILPRKRIVVEPGSCLAGVLGPRPVRVNALHRQAIDRLGHGMRVAARDRNGIVQAIEHESLPSRSIAWWWMLLTRPPSSPG